jgi:hypothetical protein
MLMLKGFCHQGFYVSAGKRGAKGDRFSALADEGVVGACHALTLYYLLNTRSLADPRERYREKNAGYYEKYGVTR